MKKILSVEQVRLADQFTIDHEPIKSIDLMERASIAFVDKLGQLFTKEKSVAVICGPGNNGGDGFAVARILKARGYSVSCYEVQSNNLSEDCARNRERFIQVGEVLNFAEVLGQPIGADIIIDGIFGSGLTRPVIEGKFKMAIETINCSGKIVCSIDIPSGLFADRINLSGEIVKADHTITFQSPKLTFLILEGGSYSGQLHIVDIGLFGLFLDQQESAYQLVEEADISRLLKRRGKFSHKGNFGRVQVIAGSLGKMGAAFLCGKACLKVGAGLLTMNIPAHGNDIIQTGLPEAMTILDKEASCISSIELLEQTDVFCLGPGLGTTDMTKNAIREFLENSDGKPMVLDADALNIIAEKKELISLIPRGSVLTPHAKEFKRLFGQNENSLEKIELMRSFSQKTGVIVVSKGAHSVISSDGGEIYFNSTGNPGMATAGSGDVLAGIISGLLAQGFKSQDAAIAGVYMHGMAGDIAAKKGGEMSLMASDLLKTLPEAISNVQNADFI